MQMMISGAGGDHHVFSIPSSLKGFSQEPPADSNPNPKTISNNNNTAAKKRRNLPGTPDPDAEVIALSPKTLMATNRFVCEICNKGFQRDQNLQLHRRGHNLPWKLKQRAKTEIPKKKVYICPETACVHHDPARALGDLTGIKKHFSRKHGEKKWKCEKCSKKYAVQSDWKAHSKTCGTREYKCDCGTLFSRKDSFITHRAFCDALAEESARITSLPPPNLNFTNDPLNEGINNISHSNLQPGFAGIPQFGGGFRPNFHGMATGGSSLMSQEQQKPRLSLWLDHQANSQINPIDMAMNSNNLSDIFQMAQSNLFGSSPMPNFGQLNQSNWVEKNVATPKSANHSLSGGVSKGSITASDQTMASIYSDTQNQRPNSPAPPMSATALLQKAAQMGSTRSNNPSVMGNSFGVMNSNSANSNNATSGFNVLVSNEGNLAMGGSSLSSLVSTTTSSNLEQFMMQSGMAQVNQGSNRVENGPTRDFLGVGGEGGRPFLPQELAKFASMGAAMGLGHFTTNH